MLRFVYFETLASILKSFGFENLIDFETLKKEYKNKEAYGALVIVLNYDRQSTIQPWWLGLYKHLLIILITICDRWFESHRVWYINRPKSTGFVAVTCRMPGLRVYDTCLDVSCQSNCDQNLCFVKQFINSP